MKKKSYSWTKTLKNGGAVYIAGSSYVSFINSTISNNFAEQSGGGIYITDNATVTIGGTKISFNLALYKNGGGIVCDYNADCLIHKKSAIEGNKAKVSGGGIYTSSTQLAVVESKMISNIAK